MSRDFLFCEVAQLSHLWPGYNAPNLPWIKTGRGRRAQLGRNVLMPAAPSRPAPPIVALVSTDNDIKKQHRLLGRVLTRGTVEPRPDKGLGQ